MHSTFGILQAQLHNASVHREDLASVIRTARKHGHDFVDLTKRALQQASQVIVDLCGLDFAPPIWLAPATQPN